MNKTLLSLACTVLLGGVSAASAQVPAYYHGQRVYVDLDSDRDGIPDQYDPRDDRYTNNGSIIRYDRFGNRLDAVRSDSDCDENRDDEDDDDDCVAVSGPVDERSTATPYYAPTYVEPYDDQNTRWEVGATLPASYVGDQNYVDYREYGLSAPSDGYRWNRVGNNVYLITDDGLIVEAVYDLFH